MKKYIIVSMILIGFLTGCMKENKIQLDEIDNNIVTTPPTVNKIETVTSDDIEVNYDYDKTIDSNYIRALRTLDEFLYFWMYRNWPEGINLVSETLKQEKSEDEIKMAICGLSNPHHMSFEVMGGKKIDNDTYRFNVWLYEDITGGDQGTFDRSKPLLIDVKRYNYEGTENWLINKF